MHKNDPNAPHQPIDSSPTEHLPDRTDLSKLYPTPTPTPNASHDARNDSSDESRASETQKLMSIQRAVIIALQTSLPIIISLIAAKYLVENTRWANIFFILPLVSLTMVSMAIFLVLLYKKISKEIYEYNINETMFFSIYLCLTLLHTPAVYDFGHISQVAILDQILPITLLAFSSFITAFILLSIVYNTTLSNRLRAAVLVTFATFAITLALLYLFTHI